MFALLCASCVVCVYAEESTAHGSHHDRHVHSTDDQHDAEFDHDAVIGIG